MLMLEIYSQNDKTGVLEVLKNKIFFAANRDGFYNSVVVSLGVPWKQE